jgi:CBS domain-containing protein
MLVRDCMTKEPVTVERSDTLASAYMKMKEGGFRRIPVVLAGEVIGILTEYDLRPYMELRDSILVGSAMTPAPVTVSPSATLEHAIALLRKNQIGALPVVEHGSLVGIITASDLWFPTPRPLLEGARH